MSAAVPPVPPAPDPRIVHADGVRLAEDTDGAQHPAQPASLHEVLGGWRNGVDASLPALAFVVALLIAEQTVPLYRTEAALAAGAGAGLAVACWRLLRRRSPRAAVMGLLPVIGGALIAAYTGRAEDFFLVRILANVASALVWLTANWIGRPLLGVVVGNVLRQHGRWRADPALFAGYSRASWWWIGAFSFRTVTFIALWVAGEPVVLGIAQVVLSWPLTALIMVLSWWTLRRALPHGHPGITHPLVESAR